MINTISGGVIMLKINVPGSMRIIVISCYTSRFMFHAIIAACFGTENVQKLFFTYSQFSKNAFRPNMVIWPR